MQTMMQILDCFKLYILFITCDGVLVQNCIESLSLVMRCDAVHLLSPTAREAGKPTIMSHTADFCC